MLPIPPLSLLACSAPPPSSHTAENAPSQHIRSAQILHAIVTTSSLCLFRMSVCELRACVRMYFPLLCWTTTADAENVLPVGGSVPGGELHAFLLLSNGGTLLRVFCTCCVYTCEDSCTIGIHGIRLQPLGLAVAALPSFVFPQKCMPEKQEQAQSLQK